MDGRALELLFLLQLGIAVVLMGKYLQAMRCTSLSERKNGRDRVSTVVTESRIYVLPSPLRFQTQPCPILPIGSASQQRSLVPSHVRAPTADPCHELHDLKQSTAWNHSTLTHLVRAFLSTMCRMLETCHCCCAFDLDR